MKRNRRTAGAAVAVALALAGVSACGDDDNGGIAGDNGEWAPDGPIQYIAPAGAGGGWDTLARTTGQVLEDSDLVDVRFPVENMPGGGGAIAWAYVAEAGDPHTLFVTSPPIILVPLSGESAYDHSDFTPIARLIADYNVYGVRADSSIESIEELFEAMADDPAFSIAGGSAVGSMDHIAMAGAAAAAGIPAGGVNYVAFEGGGEALVAAVGGHTDAVVTDVASATPMVESGDIRVLAVSGEERVATLPDVPTLQESGVDFTFDIWRGVMGPPDMSESQIAYYEQLYADMLELDSWAQERDRLGWTNAYLGSDEFGAFLDEQQDLFRTILSDLGLVD